MAKPQLRIKARELRSKGESVIVIAKQLGVSKSTVSYWVRDIILSIKQLEKLRNSQLKGAERGRLKGALKQKRQRLKLIETSKKNGLKSIGKLSKKEFLISGIALYWAEGTKKRQIVQIVNSDPNMIIFMIRWLKTFFNINYDDLVARVGINYIHKEREDVVIKYWSKKTGIPLSRFKKTSFKKVKNKKYYKNFDQHFGTLDIRVLKSSRFSYKINGLIYGLSKAG